MGRAPNPYRAHMKAGWITGAALVVLFGCRGAFAESCVINNRQVYNLVTDTVNWSMRVGSGQNCRYGVRYAKVQLERMKLVSPPRAGQVVLQGSAFTYITRKDFQGDDSFDLEVAGQIQKIPGSSTIHVAVSVGSATKSPEPTHATARTPTSAPHEAVPTLPMPVPSTGGPAPPVKDALGPAPVPTPPDPGTAAPTPVLQLGTGPAPMLTPPLPGAAPAPMPPVPSASSASPFRTIDPAKSP
jgi:hypothetical protein